MIGGGVCRPSKETDVLCLVVREVADLPRGLEVDLLLEGDRDGEGALDEARADIWVMPALMVFAMEANSCNMADISDCGAGTGWGACSGAA